jgi:hypothetical protein
MVIGPNQEVIACKCTYIREEKEAVRAAVVTVAAVPVISTNFVLGYRYFLR